MEYGGQFESAAEASLTLRVLGAVVVVVPARHLHFGSIRDQLARAR